MDRTKLIQVLAMYRNNKINTEEACIMIENLVKFPDEPLPQHLTPGCLKTE